MTLGEVVEKYRKQISVSDKRPASYREFADQINVFLNGNHVYGWAHWYKVAHGTYLPNFYAMRYLADTATGWVKDFGLEMVKLLEE